VVPAGVAVTKETAATMVVLVVLVAAPAELAVVLPTLPGVVAVVRQQPVVLLVRAETIPVPQVRH
jgi:hypothetical protein